MTECWILTIIEDTIKFQVNLLIYTNRTLEIIENGNTKVK